MPKLIGVREKRHQPFYDSIIRVAADTAPTPTVSQRVRLFASGTNLGDNSWTNMAQASSLPSDQSYVIYAMRCFMQFNGSSALTMYQQTASQLFLQLVVGDKPQFGAFSWYFPQGGGIWGFDSTTPTMTNGVPETTAILKLAKPIAVPARQNFYVEAEFFDLGSTSVRTSYLNASTTIGTRIIQVLIDGIQTRDVQ
jgi:hypothetical protein